MKKFLIRAGFFSQLNFLVEAADEREAEKLLMDHLNEPKERLTSKLEEIVREGLDHENGSIIHLQDREDGEFCVESEETHRVSSDDDKTPYFIILCISKEIHQFEIKPERVDKVYENRDEAEERASFLNKQNEQDVYWVEEVELKVK